MRERQGRTATHLSNEGHLLGLKQSLLQCMRWHGAPPCSFMPFHPLPSQQPGPASIFAFARSIIPRARNDGPPVEPRRSGRRGCNVSRHRLGNEPNEGSTNVRLAGVRLKDDVPHSVALGIAQLGKLMQERSQMRVSFLGRWVFLCFPDADCWQIHRLGLDLRLTNEDRFHLSTLEISARSSRCAACTLGTRQVKACERLQQRDAVCFGHVKMTRDNGLTLNCSKVEPPACTLLPLPCVYWTRPVNEEADRPERTNDLVPLSIPKCSVCQR